MFSTNPTYLRICYGGGGDNYFIGRKVDSAVHINSYLNPFQRVQNDSTLRPVNNTHNPDLVVFQTIYANYEDLMPGKTFMFQALQLEPTLEYDVSGYPIINPTDKDGSIFGW
ncbi:hypothetical protein D9V84_11255 [Bacteroidetes/Chlorobi group bacterium Naka2016]|nr:MAG: hypothetical protein D9V84_11255 [Bacteroidetes/Chlorobi group bacterium Naka2016]